MSEAPPPLCYGCEVARLQLARGGHQRVGCSMCGSAWVGCTGFRLAPMSPEVWQASAFALKHQIEHAIAHAEHVVETWNRAERGVDEPSRVADPDGRLARYVLWLSRQIDPQPKWTPGKRAA